MFFSSVYCFLLAGFTNGFLGISAPFDRQSVVDCQILRHLPHIDENLQTGNFSGYEALFL
jgi:hypothetical protein